MTVVPTLRYYDRELRRRLEYYRRKRRDVATPPARDSRPTYRRAEPSLRAAKTLIFAFAVSPKNPDSLGLDQSGDVHLIPTRSR